VSAGGTRTKRLRLRSAQRRTASARRRVRRGSPRRALRAAAGAKSRGLANCANAGRTRSGTGASFASSPSAAAATFSLLRSSLASSMDPARVSLLSVSAQWKERPSTCCSTTALTVQEKVSRSPRARCGGGARRAAAARGDALRRTGRTRVTAGCRRRGNVYEPGQPAWRLRAREIDDDPGAMLTGCPRGGAGPSSRIQERSVSRVLHRLPISMSLRASDHSSCLPRGGASALTRRRRLRSVVASSVEPLAPPLRPLESRSTLLRSLAAAASLASLPRARCAYAVFPPRAADGPVRRQS